MGDVFAMSTIKEVMRTQSTVLELPPLSPMPVSESLLFVYSDMFALA